jgi:hypothetical protein
LFGGSKRRSRRNRRRARVMERVRGLADLPTADRVALRRPVRSRPVALCRAHRHRRRRPRKQHHQPRRHRSQGQCPSQVRVRYRNRRVRFPAPVAAALSVLPDPRPPRRLRRPRQCRPRLPLHRPLPLRRHRLRRLRRHRNRLRPLRPLPVQRVRVLAASVPVRDKARVRASKVSRASKVRGSRVVRARDSSVRVPAPAVRVLAAPVSVVRPARRARVQATTHSARPRPAWARPRRPRPVPALRVRQRPVPSASLAVRVLGSQERPAQVPPVRAVVVLAAPEHPARPRVTVVPVPVVRVLVVRARAR